MRKQLSILLTVILLAGCTMQKERNEILNKMEEMGSKLSELTSLANEKDFSQFKAQDASDATRICSEHA